VFLLLLLLLDLQALLHEGFLVVQGLVDLRGDGLARQTIEVLGKLVEELPFLNGVAVDGVLVVLLFDLLKITYELTELTVLIGVDALLYGFRYAFRLLFVLLLPDAAVLP
jgi:hypothetical protein